MSSTLLLAAAKATPGHGEVGAGFVQSRTHKDCIQRNDICPSWAWHHLSQWGTPLVEHLVLVGASVALGFAVSFAMALIAHRWRPAGVPFLAISDVLFTIPSIAFFVLLIPVTGLGRTSAIIALSAYTLVILFRNTYGGLRNVPDEVKDAGRGMGLSDRQLLWRVELPLAVPEIIAGLRIATVSTVAIATLAVFIDGGGLGTQIYPNISFKTGVLVTGVILLALAFVLDSILVLVQRLFTPWRRAVATS
jgi:osmoprotectant transport system permease protein